MFGAAQDVLHQMNATNSFGPPNPVFTVALQQVMQLSKACLWLPACVEDKDWSQ